VTAVLHGHMHQPSLAYARRPVDLTSTDGSAVEEMPGLAVCGLGSTGAARAELGEVGRNVFGVLSFEGDRMLLEMRALDPQSEEAPDTLFASVTAPLRRT
jgi:hypothetical protein